MTTTPSPRTPVIAAVLRRDLRFLVARRPAEKRHGGLWEFPGGKVEPGESWLEAARRELDEELGIVVVSIGEARLSVADEGSRFEIHFVDVSATGEPQALEHSELAWLTPAELSSLPLAPADARFVSLLREAD